MRKFRIGCVWQMYGHIEVEAETEEEAIKKACAVADECPLPDDGEYLDDSFNVDPENVEEADD